MIASASLGGLPCTLLGDDDPPGGVAVVLLHGWSDDGGEMVDLAQRLRRPGVRFAVPVAPLDAAEGDGATGGRAWWHFDPEGRPGWAWDAEPPGGYVPRPLVEAARAAVQQVLAGIRDRWAPDELALVGHSQGAMLALDVALAEGAAVDRVVALAGVLIADSLPALRVPAASTTYLLAHGSADDVVPFAAGERAVELLRGAGRDVRWWPHGGGHAVPTGFDADLAGFVAGHGR